MNSDRGGNSDEKTQIGEVILMKKLRQGR